MISADTDQISVYHTVAMRTTWPHKPTSPISCSLDASRCAFRQHHILKRSHTCIEISPFSPQLHLHKSCLSHITPQTTPHASHSDRNHFPGRRHPQRSARKRPTDRPLMTGHRHFSAASQQGTSVPQQAGIGSRQHRDSCAAVSMVDFSTWDSGVPTHG
jgi:hypothetical protein